MFRQLFFSSTDKWNSDFELSIRSASLLTPSTPKEVTVIAVVVFQIHDLEYPQQIPLRLPSVDNATPTGAIQARDGKALLAKVIATAGDARNSSFVISVK